MATRSTIAMECKDGSIKQIYCHYDGYPIYNGFILEEYYKDQKKVEKLLNLGNIKSLGKDIDKEGLYHTEDTTFALIRDAGLKEEEVPSSVFTHSNLTQKFANKDEYLKKANFQGHDYFMDKDSNWWYMGWDNEDHNKWEKLEDHLGRLPDEEAHYIENQELKIKQLEEKLAQKQKELVSLKANHKIMQEKHIKSKLQNISDTLNSKKSISEKEKALNELNKLAQKPLNPDNQKILQMLQNKYTEKKGLAI